MIVESASRRGQILRCLSGRTLGRDICLSSVRTQLFQTEFDGANAYLGHAAVNDKICAVYEAAFVAGQEQDRLCLFDGLSESAGWEMYLSAVTLCCIIA
jgi:hypothetical protein